MKISKMECICVSINLESLCTDIFLLPVNHQGFIVTVKLLVLEIFLSNMEGGICCLLLLYLYIQNGIIIFIHVLFILCSPSRGHKSLCL